MGKYYLRTTGNIEFVMGEEEVPNCRLVLSGVLRRSGVSRRRIGALNDKYKSTSNVRVYRGSCCVTDNCLLKTTFYVPPRQLMERLKYEENYHQKCNKIKNNLYSLSDESTKTLYQQRLLQKLGENASESAETLCEHVCDGIHSAAREPLGEQEKGKKEGRIYVYIWSEEIEDAVRRKQSSYLTTISTKKTEDWENYKK